MVENEITKVIIRGAIKVHKSLGQNCYNHHTKSVWDHELQKQFWKLKDKNLCPQCIKK